MASTSDQALHRAITARLLLETAAVLLGLGGLAVAVAHEPALPRPLVALVCALQGCWLHRLYVVGHEAVHHKLFPEDRRLNDLVGQLVLLPLMVPLRVYRKIHRFHHGQNRRDHHTSALDTFVVPAGAGPLRRLYCRIVWYLAVFGGGWFIHSLVSVVLFLALPLRVARRVSPAFEGWSAGDRWASIATFAAGVGLHLAVAYGLGAEVWALTLGWPFLAFAWVYSLLVYIYHYDTSYGSPVRDNVRSLAPNRALSWWLLNFNEHATHHADASLPWHRLPAERRPPSPALAANQKVSTIGAAILRQLRGPRIIDATDATDASDAHPGEP
ncbi:MAG: fatty acid desaturase [Myxococcales bacterium]|nr:fatty acid desaturase [Myxococcales bacterium]